MPSHFGSSSGPITKARNFDLGFGSGPGSCKAMSWSGYVPTGPAAEGGGSFPQAGQPVQLGPSGSNEQDHVRAAQVRAATEFGCNPNQLRPAPQFAQQVPVVPKAPPPPVAEINRQSAREQYQGWAGDHGRRRQIGNAAHNPRNFDPPRFGARLAAGRAGQWSSILKYVRDERLVPHGHL